MGGNRGTGSARPRDGPDKFAEHLYVVYRHGLGGELRFDDFIKHQLANDLLTEFARSDREWRKSILADVARLLTAEDFETDDDW
ncbi:hypothetical protein [Falsiroseomonas sp. HW251]|uniref:hypothetical protein n=1 Tax=Falsiroseomonas sp. HW251 TaxID=3390998 RepID=UPI003D31BB21